MTDEGTPGGAGRWRKPTVWALVLIFALGLGLRARAVDHGMPRNYVPDTHIVRSALGMAQEKNPAPPVGKYSTYPNLLPYMLLPAFGTHYVVGRLTGDWGGVQEYKLRLSLDASPVHSIARWLILLFGAATPLVVFGAARAAGLKRGAWFASWFVATGLMHLHFSVQERPWVAVVFFTALAAWPAALYVREPSTRRLLYSGLFGALAAACHQSGLFVLGVPGIAWLVSPLGWSGTDLRARLHQGATCVGVFLLAALFIGYPSYLVHGFPEAEQTIGGDAADASFGGQSINFGRRWETFPHLARSFFAYDPILSILALLGLVPLLRRRVAWPAGLFALGWAAFFMTHSNEQVRYLLPLAVLLSLAAGALAEALWVRGPAFRIGLVVLGALPLVQGVRLGSVLATEDLRAEGERILEDLPAGTFVAIDRYGPAVDLDRQSLERLAELRQATGSELYGREATRLEALKAGWIEGGVRAIHVSDLFEMDELTGSVSVRDGLQERLGSTAEEAFERLGITHLLLANRLEAGLSENLLADLVGERVPQAVLVPYEKADGVGEARLPMELEFPLTSIWNLARPGPWMGLYELKRASQ